MFSVKMNGGEIRSIETDIADEADDVVPNTNANGENIEGGDAMGGSAS